MGATISILQANQLPEVIEQTEFFSLTGNKFSTESYDVFADHNGKISRQRLLEIVSMTDCYLSHEWGFDKEGRNTCERVQKIGKFLQSKGLYATFDEGQVKGNVSFDAIKERIRNAQCVILCMTERYFYQASSPVNNPTKVEFEEIMNNKDLRVLVPVILEKAAFSIPTFITTACPQFTFKTHLDFTQFNDIGNEDALMLADLYLYVTRCIHPLRLGGSFRQQRNQFLSTIVGRHYKWLLLHLPKLGHTLSLKYAEIFGQNNIESTARLWQLLQHNAGYLQVLLIPEKDSILIRNALKADLEGNFDIINAKKIDAVIAHQERINDAELQAIHERNAVAIDIKVKFTELKNMSIEDERSRNFREECRMEAAHGKYLQGRQALLAISDHQHAKYHTMLQGMREAQRHREVTLDREWRSEDFVSIGRITEPAVACAALYRLFVKIDRATAHLLPDQVILDDPEGVDCFGDYSENEHLKRRRVQSFIERAIINREQTSVKEETDVTANLDSFEEKNNRLVYLLQEAAYICRAVVNVAHNNPEHVFQFKESGIVKPVMSLLAQVYLFSCRFESLFMPMSFHYLAMPTEALLAIRYLVKCGTGRRRTSAKMSFLFAEAGAIALCLEVIKFHLNDMTIASVAIETLFVLIDAPGVAAANLKLLMQDVNNLILLIVVLEKYSEYFSPVAINLHSCIIGIIAHLMHTGEYDTILRVYRGQLMVPIFDTILPLIDETAEPELCTRLCVSIQYIWFSPEYQNSHYFTSDFVPKNESFAREVAKYANFRVVLRFLKKIMTIHFADDVVILAAMLALGNIVFNNDKIKQEAYKMKLHESVAKVLRDRMRRLDAIGALDDRAVQAQVNEESKCDALEEVAVLRGQLHVTREVLFEGLITAANLIIVPPFLTYDTVQPDANVGMAQQIVNAQLKSPHKGVTAAAGGVKSAAAVQEEAKNALAHFVQAGLSELVMNLITNHMEDRVLVRSVLIFANKFMYRGRFMSASRLVKLRFCEKLTSALKLYVEDDEIFMLGVMVVIGLFSSHPGLIGAAKRLIQGDLCELLTISMRHKCQQKQCSQSSMWTHFSFPYTCRVCVVHCTAVYCCLLSDPDCFQDAYDRFLQMYFHGMLKCPPGYLNESLTLEEAVPGGIIPAPRESHASIQDNASKACLTVAHHRSSTYKAQHGEEGQSEEGEESTVLPSAEALARQRLVTAGVFHRHNAPSLPEAVGNLDTLKESEVSEAAYRGSVRNIEYVAYMTRQEKDHIMHMLFKLFNIE